MGSGGERYPGYQPIVISRDKARDGSVLGELRISKLLIESLAKPVQVANFRPGHLSNPQVLPQALEATGYRFSSSVRAGNVLSHLPIHLTYGRGAESETGTIEFPLTVEEERAPLMGLCFRQSAGRREQDLPVTAATILCSSIPTSLGTSSNSSAVSRRRCRARPDSEALPSLGAAPPTTTARLRAPDKPSRSKACTWWRSSRPPRGR